MMVGSGIVISNLLAYLLLVLYLKRTNKSKISIFVAIIWTIAAAFALLFFYLNDGLFLWRRYDSLSLAPFLYIYICVLLCILPLAKIKDRRVIIIDGNVKLLTSFSRIIVILSFFPFLGNLFYAATHLGTSVSSFADNYGKEVEVLPGFLSFLNVFNKYFRTFVPILLFYNLQHNKPNKVLLFGLIFASLNPMLGNLNSGLRFVFLADAIYIVSIYILLSSTLRENLRKAVRFYGFIALGFSGLIFILISVYRFVNVQSVDVYIDLLRSFGLYAGEGMLNFNQNMWDITTRTDGANTMMFAKYLLGESTTSVRNGELVSEMAGIPLYIYYTIVGDFYIDYGPFVTIGIFVGLFIFLNILIRQKSIFISFYRLVLLGIILRAIVVGFTYFPYMNVSMELIYVPILNGILYIIDSTMKNKNKAVKHF